MDKNKFKILYITPIFFIARGRTRSITVVVKNIGSSTWHDPTWENHQHHVVGGLVNIEKKRDFNLMWGKHTGRKVDRQFRKIYSRFFFPMLSEKNSVKPQQVLKLKLRIEARKFATSGSNTLKLALFIRGQDKEQVMTGNPKSTLCVVVPGIKQWWYLIKTLKLHFINIGKVESTYSNNAFKQNTRQTQALPVIMATWNRINLLPKTLKSLSEQSGSSPVLYLWNNNLSARDSINHIAKTSLLPVKIYHSKHNIGGFGRFYLAKEIATSYKRVIFIDDDQFPETEYIKNINEEYQVHTIKSQWAYRFIDRSNYWHKEFVNPGENADYCGTGGMLANTGIFTEDGLYKCPKRYWFIEDLWLSYFAKYELGWQLTRTEADLPIIEDGSDQLVNLIDAKTSFYKYLENKY